MRFIKEEILKKMLDDLLRLSVRDNWRAFVSEDPTDDWKPAEQGGLDTILTIIDLLEKPQFLVFKQLIDERIIEIRKAVKSTPVQWGDTLPFARAIEEEVRPVVIQQELTLLGEMREDGVTWFNQNPHAWPIGTKFYADNTGVKDGYTTHKRT